MADKDFTAQEGNTTPKPKSRRKTIAKQKLVSNVFPINKHRNERLAGFKYENKAKEYLNRLSDEHHDVVLDYLDILWGRNTRNEDTYQTAQVIPFPVGGKRALQIAKEA